MLHPTMTTHPMTAAELAAEGLLRLGSGCRLHPAAVLIPADVRGERRPIVLGDRVTVGANAVLHGGLVIGPDTHVGHGAIVGEPEYGYAAREVYSGEGAETLIGAEAVIRASAIVYAGCTVGGGTTVGHHTLLRTDVTVGANSQLAANLTVERRVRIGSEVRCSPGSHLTADTFVGDRAFVGAGVRTINDKHLIWRDAENGLPLAPPRLGTGCRIGTGAIIFAGVSIGPDALVGAGAIVTCDVPASAVVFGVPARLRGRTTR